MDIKISQMNEEDLNILKDILIEDFDEFWSFSTLKEELACTNSYYIVAKENNNIVGFAGIKKILDEVDLMNIVTQKSKRNFGIASMLLENLINKSIELGASVMTLEVDENNSPALHLYEKYDFKKVGLRKKYYNGINNAVIMTKDLKIGGKNK
jgi:ribosomal-protein-alanine N-acetyltransferase